MCVDFTIISIQQLSDIDKYNCSILKKIGLSKREVNKVIVKQLIGFYYFPMIIAMLIGAVFSIYASRYFNCYTGLDSSVYSNFVVSTMKYISFI